VITLLIYPCAIVALFALYGLMRAFVVLLAVYGLMLRWGANHDRR